MATDHTPAAKPPKDFSEVEIQDFICMVHAGGEVADKYLERNVRNAECLVVLRQNSCLVGVAALKKPSSRYRRTIREKTGIALNDQEFPFELGYVFVLPSARRQGIGLRLCISALSSADRGGVFATARTTNDGMFAMLPTLGFSKTGLPYLSDRGRYELQLFARPRCIPPALGKA